MLPNTNTFKPAVNALRPARPRAASAPGLTAVCRPSRWLATVPPPAAVESEALRDRLDRLLTSLPAYVDGAVHKLLGGQPAAPAAPLPADTETKRRRIPLPLPLSLPVSLPLSLPPGVDGLPSAADMSAAAGNALLFAVDALTPWDFDRHDFGVTFASTWESRELLVPPALRAAVAAAEASVNANGKGGGRAAAAKKGRAVVRAPKGGRGGARGAAEAVRAPVVLPGSIKVTSTLKPAEREWKVTARTKLWESDDGLGVVFGKAGMFLAGKPAPYIGMEADRVWELPQQLGWKRTKVFGNVNYRSSRLPKVDPVRWSFGLQRSFDVGEGLDITMRVGVRPFDRRWLLVTPVPNGKYY